MAVNGIEIEVGQKWLTEDGDFVEITSTESGEYCFIGYCEGVERSWNEFGIHDVNNPNNGLQLVTKLGIVSHMNNVEKQHSHYFKDVSHLTHIDVYRVLDLFNVTDPCLQHSVKKLLCAGGRGDKDFEKDVREAGDSIARKLEMMAEDAEKV